MSLREFLCESFERFAQEPALLWEGGSCNYEELGCRSWGRVQQWLDLGLVPGDRVAAYLPNSPEYLEVYFACALSGFVLVPLNLRLHARELRVILKDAGPRILLRSTASASGEEQQSLTSALEEPSSIEHVIEVHGAQVLPVWSAELESPGERDSAQIYYTSGTTGRPKGVVLQHQHVLAHAQAAMGEFDLSSKDVWGHFAPMFHLADAWACFAMAGAGAAHCFLPRFDAKACFGLIASGGVTLMNLVPTMLQGMVACGDGQGNSVGSLRMVLSGGAPIAPELVRRVQALFACEYVQTYGLTETSPFLTVSLLSDELRALDDEQRFFYASRTGRPFGSVELRVIGADAQAVPADGKSVGEIQARGDWVFEEYWNQPEASAAAFDGGWFLTGDLATLEERGFLNIVDRKKDIILCGGETVYSTEVENALYTHQLVSLAAAFPMEDPHWGEVVAVAVVCEQGPGKRLLKAPELVAHCRLFLAPYKVPHLIYFVDEFPMTGSGKVQKRLLRELCLDLVGERLTR